MFSKPPPFTAGSPSDANPVTKAFDDVAFDLNPVVIANPVVNLRAICITDAVDENDQFCTELDFYDNVGNNFKDAYNYQNTNKLDSTEWPFSDSLFDSIKNTGNVDDLVGGSELESWYASNCS